MVLLLPVGLLLLLLLLVAVVVGLVRHHLLTFGAFPFRALAFLIRFLAPPSAHARGCRAQQPLAHVQAGRVDVAPTAPALADETISASRRPRVPFLWCVALWPSRRLCATLRFCVALWPIAAAGDASAGVLSLMDGSAGALFANDARVGAGVAAGGGLLSEAPWACGVYGE